MSDGRQGFTLIELLVVVAIIGTLTGLATVNFQGARERARDAQRKGDLKQIQQALELYKDDQSPYAYPLTASWDSDLEAGGYMNSVPVDPKTSVSSWEEYKYARSRPLEYTLVACLENAADADKDASNSCTNGYSYTLTQP